MFIAIYRWKIKKGCEAAFQEGWRKRTLEIREKHGGLGSRLHQAQDGTWIAYAQWRDRETWEAAQPIPVIDEEAVALMRDSIESRLPDLYLTVAEDLLVPFTKQ